MGIVLRILLVLAIAMGGFILWYSQARNLALLADRLGTSRPLGTKALTEIGWNGTYPVIDNQDLGFSNSKDQTVLRVGVDAAHRLVASANGQSIVLGIERGTLSVPGDPEPKPAFHAEPGDHVTLSSAMGRVIWPNWFETNWISGNSPRWKRFITYRLRWEKPSGESLALFWRYEQYYYLQDGWVAANMTGDTDCGLVDVRITKVANVTDASK